MKKLASQNVKYRRNDCFTMRKITFVFFKIINTNIGIQKLNEETRITKTTYSEIPFI